MNTALEDAYDVVVVGAGAAGMAAALTAALRGLSVVVVEATEYFGGSTAFSGGAIWVPGNKYTLSNGVSDTPEEGRAYLAATVGERVSKARRDAYLRDGRAMIDEFDNATQWVRWSSIPVPDYRPEEPGGKPEGRAIEAAIVDANHLGAEQPRLRPPSPAMDVKGMTVTAADFVGLNMVTRTRAGRITAFRVVKRFVTSRLRGQRLLGVGQALATRLRLALRDAEVPVVYSTPLRELVVEDGRVCGVRVQDGGTEQTVQARCGVVLAAGGFAKNQQMREEYMQRPTRTAWSLTPEDGQDGTGIQAGLAVGAAVARMEWAWGMPTALIPKGDHEGLPLMTLSERGLPGTLTVDDRGRRYANEALSYDDFWAQMYAHDRGPDGPRTVPSWLVFDQRAKDRYMFLTVMPRQPFPRSWYEKGYVYRAGGLEALARAMNVPVENLTATVERFNRDARTGKDTEFGRGESAYDRFYGDPTLPQANLDALDKGPFYAVRLYPGDLGTKGGLDIDEHSRVLRPDGSVIDGLYAGGNCAAGVMGETYPGPGATLGAAMVAGYAAANHLAGREPQARATGPTPAEEVSDGLGTRPTPR